MRTLFPSLLGLLLATACAIDEGNARDPISEDDVSSDDDVGEEVDGDCKKIEGGEIGVIDLELDVAGIIVRFESWQPKDGEPDEFVGFTYSTSAGSIHFTVKAAGELHEGDASPWIHPGGTGGPDAPGISNIVVCPPEDPDDGDDGDEGEDPIP
jgi:hypothetical protein